MTDRELAQFNDLEALCDLILSTTFGRRRDAGRPVFAAHAGAARAGKIADDLFQALQAHSSIEPRHLSRVDRLRTRSC